MAGNHPSHPSGFRLIIPPSRGSSVAARPSPPLEQPAHPPLLDPTNPGSPEAKVELTVTRAALALWAANPHLTGGNALFERVRALVADVLVIGMGSPR